jgi:dethiobiotin synthetase
MKPAEHPGSESEAAEHDPLMQSGFDSTTNFLLTSALVGNQPLDLEQIWQQLQPLRRQDFVLVEAWGGLGSPLTAETTVADLAWDWHLPTVLIVPVQASTVAHAVANVALARQSKLHLKGIILNMIQQSGQQDWAPIELIQSLTHKPVLGVIPYLENPYDLDKLVQVASTWELERLLPGLEGAISH